MQLFWFAMQIRNTKECFSISFLAQLNNVLSKGNPGLMIPSQKYFETIFPGHETS